MDDEAQGNSLKAWRSRSNKGGLSFQIREESRMNPLGDGRKGGRGGGDEVNFTRI